MGSFATVFLCCLALLLSVFAVLFALDHFNLVPLALAQFMFTVACFFIGVRSHFRCLLRLCSPLPVARVVCSLERTCCCTDAQFDVHVSGLNRSVFDVALYVLILFFCVGVVSAWVTTVLGLHVCSEKFWYCLCVACMWVLYVLADFQCYFSSLLHEDFVSLNLLVFCFIWGIWWWERDNLIWLW